MHECPICNKIFKKYTYYTSHIRQHEKEENEKIAFFQQLLK